MMNDRLQDMEPGTAPQGCGSIQVPLCDRTVTADIAGDFSLPDYQPEIRRLLRVGASVQPPAAYAGGNGMELSGTVDYFVLYVGNDGQVYCSPLTTEYRMQIPFEGGGETQVSEPFVCICAPCVEGASGRVTAPRRLNIRCRVKARAKVYGERDLSCPDEGGLVPGSIERLEQTAEVARVFCGTSETVTLSDDMILPAGTDMRVVCAEGQVMISEATAGSGIVTCRGDVTLKLLLSPLEGAEEPIEGGDDTSRSPAVPTVAQRRVPFTVTVDMPGVTPDCTACGYGGCPELSVQVEEGRIHTELGVSVQVTAQRNETVTYTGDLYSTRTEGECRFADCPAEVARHAVQGNFTLSDSLPLSEAGIDPSAQVVDMTATAQVESVTCEKGRCLSVGTCRFQLLLCRGGEWSTAEVELPFRYECELSVGTTSTSPVFDADVTVIGSRARMDGERVGLDAEVGVALRLTDPLSLHTLSGFSLGADISRPRGEYLICFPAPTDSLWSVAKRYHAPLTALAAANDLPSADSPADVSSLAGVGYLIV